jgi:hypothetical protein
MNAAMTKFSSEGDVGRQVRAIALDAYVERRFLEALQPDQVAIALAALQQLEQAEQAERKQWDLRLERARYEAKRAERQYQTVEPENRLVARSLERQWEDKLRAVEAIEKEYQTWSYSRLAPITEADREAIVELGSDLRALWQAETTTSGERKQMLRLAIRDVIVDGMGYSNRQDQRERTQPGPMGRRHLLGPRRCGPAGSLSRNYSQMAQGRQTHWTPASQRHALD